MTLLAQVAAVSRRVADTPSRLAKVREIAECLKQLQQAEIRIAIAYLSGEIRQGKLGVSYASLRSALTVPSDTKTRGTSRSSSHGNGVASGRSLMEGPTKR